tara:strand:+ start:1600 stop:1815 length:216 start_codon:yes stop_codon:yes gene_type:complete
MRNSPLKSFANGDNKEKSKKGLNILINKKTKQKSPRQKFIDKGIEKGTLPKPDTKEKLKQWKEAYFDERSV